MKGIVLFLGIWAILLALAACTSSQTAGGGDLTGKVWGLSELSGKPLLAGTGISAKFSADGKVSGSAGCNRYNGSYTVSGGSISIASPLAVTMMMCEPAVMEQESAYLQALGEAKTYSVEGDQLTLSGADKTKLAVYQAQSQDLAGTNWEAINFNNGQQALVSALAGTTLTASFGQDGAISGSSGCNNYTGSYSVTGNQIKIGPLASTLMACSEPEGVMEQEAQFLAAMQSAATYQIEGGWLELRTQDDAMAVYLTKK